MKPSLAQLRQIAKLTNMDIQLDLMEYRAGAPSHPTLCDLIDRAVDQCASDMARYPKEFDGQTEDQLTISVILQLNKMGLNAAHDATSGGHCDIVITDSQNFLWLGEAKKVSSIDNSWISAGYKQLVDRYATGIHNQDYGCLLIFCNYERLDEIILAWHEYFCKYHLDAVAGEIDRRKIIFLSTEPSKRTGRVYTVRHKPVSVFFPPLH